MTEKQLNLKYLKERYKHPTWEAMLEISSEQYIRGLKQGKFDCEMEQLVKWNELKKWVVEYMEEMKIQYNHSHPTKQYSLEIVIDTLQAVIKEMQELEQENEVVDKTK